MKKRLEAAARSIRFTRTRRRNGMIGAVAGPAAGAMPLGLFEAPPPASMTRRANEPWDGSQQSNSMSGWERSATLGRHDGQSAVNSKQVIL